MLQLKSLLLGISLNLGYPQAKLSCHTLLLVLLIFCSSSVYSQTLDVGLQNALKNYSDQKTMPDSNLKPINLIRGIVLAPSQFTNKRTGTIDSDRGELKSSGLLIFYDIGLMAGAHMSEKFKGDCIYYKAGTYNGYQTYIGLRKQGDETELVITIRQKEITDSFPANFWANIRNQTDIENMLAIVMNYQPRL